MVIVFILQLVTLILLLNHHKEISQELEKDFGKKWTSNDIDGFTHLMQRSLSCCGLTSKSEYGGQIPISCCPQHETNCDETNSYEVNCKDAFTERNGGLLDSSNWDLIKHIDIGRIIVIVFGILLETMAFQFIIVILGCCIMNFIYDSRFF